MDILDVIKKEHREVAAMLDQADKCDPGDKQLIELAKKIETALSTHVKEEESTVFSIARELMDPNERNELGEKWAKARQRLNASPGPRATRASRKIPARKASGKVSNT